MPQTEVRVSPAIGIVDDHPALILGTIEMLRGDPAITVSASAATVSELLTQTTALDLVLLDLSLGDESTPTRNIERLRSYGIPVLIFTGGSNVPLLQEAVRAGVLGVVLKSERPGVLLTAVHDASRGETVATAEWAASLDSDAAFVTTKLSARESEVLALYASGLTAENVGRQLFIARSTVNEHLKRIRDKYADADRPARTKHELYLRAVEDGLIEWGAR